MIADESLRELPEVPEVQPESPAASAESGDPASSLERIDRTLRDIRAILDAQVREQQHREFSAAQLVGAVLQAVVVGLLVLALLDWLYQWGVTRTYVKLAFAAVLQMMALTAFVAARPRR